MRPDETFVTSLGQILQRARLSRGLTLEEAEQATRISRRYLEALEREQFSQLPAPVYARGFLRTYASLLGLDSAQLLPLFPVSYLDQPAMQPLPRVERPPVWSASWLMAGGVTGLLVLIIALLYAFAGSGEGTPFGPTVLSTQEQALPTPAAGGESTQTVVAQGGVVPDLRGRNATQALDLLQQMGLSYFVLERFSDQAPAGEVLAQSPPPGTKVDAGEVVTLVVSRGQR